MIYSLVGYVIQEIKKMFISLHPTLYVGLVVWGFVLDLPNVRFKVYM